MTGRPAARGETRAVPTALGGLLASARAELLRLRKWPAVWVLATVWLLLNLTFAYLFNYVAYATGSSGFSNEGVAPEALLPELLPAAIPSVLTGGMPMFGGAIMFILGALAAGSGFGWGTWKTVLTQGPGRLSAFGGTLAAVGVAVVAVVAATVALDFAASTLIAVVEGQSIVWPELGALAESVGGGLLIFGMWAAAGVLVGVLTRSPALAVGLGLVWSLVIENLLRGVGNLLSGVEYVTNVLPGTAAGSVAGALGAGAEGDPDGAPGVLTVLDGGPATLLVAAYLVVFAAVAALLMRRRDVV
ncbi:ABC transporter permease [Jiangella aurantiaca]|uniref:ABC transporter permease n=2 Tax=Jiangella aurantiaca TaxID=2530373 RepID=A0A4R5A5F2_9ACTN|nr:ABC transporter permease [Jiangella aurantiaca]